MPFSRQVTLWDSDFRSGELCLSLHEKVLLQLQHISLTGFRNYGIREFELGSRITAIHGQNGTGKTNLLDAIYYQCFTKSYFPRTDASSVRHGAAGFRIAAAWTLGNQALKTACVLRENGKKEFHVDGEPLERFSSHIGRLPVVFIAPDDILLVNGGPEERRRFMDTVLSQVNPEYLQCLIRYNRILQQRNMLLKDCYKDSSMDLSLLDVYDEQLSLEGNSIFSFRTSCMSLFLHRVTELAGVVSGTDEGIQVAYSSQLQNEDLHTLLKKNRGSDLQVQRTRFGIHRDDIELRLDGVPLRQTASQGQRKSILFALKLAEYAYIQEIKGFAPLLLLDDIFEKLDEGRISNLLGWVCQDHGGQVFLTDTHHERIASAMQKKHIHYNSILI